MPAKRLSPKVLTVPYQLRALVADRLIWWSFRLDQERFFRANVVHLISPLLGQQQPVLAEVDLERGTQSDHPDIRPSPAFYIAQYDGRLYGGDFSPQHYGWNFRAVYPVGAQFDTPGYNHSRWERLWEVIMPGVERPEPTLGKVAYEQWQETRHAKA